MSWVRYGFIHNSKQRYHKNGELNFVYGSPEQVAMCFSGGIREAFDNGKIVRLIITEVTEEKES